MFYVVDEDAHGKNLARKIIGKGVCICIAVLRNRTYNAHMILMLILAASCC